MQNTSIIFVDIISYFLAFLFFPFSVAYLVKKIGKFKEVKLKFLYLFVTFTAIFSLIGDFIWQKFIFNNLYYEWDNLFQFKFSLFTKEYPVTDLGIFQVSHGQVFQGSWIAKGWSEFYLVLIGFLMAIIIYFISIFLSRKFIKVQEHFLIYMKYIKVLSVVFVILLLINGFFPVFDLVTLYIPFLLVGFLSHLLNFK